MRLWRTYTIFNLFSLVLVGVLLSPLFSWAESDLRLPPKPVVFSLVSIQSNIDSQPFDIDEKGFYLLPERLFENTPEGSSPRYLLKLDAPKNQLIIEFPFSKLKNGLPSGYAVGRQGIEKVELLQHGGSLIDLARVVLTYKAGTTLTALNLVSLSNGRLLIPNPLGGASNIVRSESRHGGGVIENTKSPTYASSPVPSNASEGSSTPVSKTKPVQGRTTIEFIEIEDQFFMLKPSLNSLPLKVKNEFYLENPHRFVLDLEPAAISPKLFSSEPDAKGAYPTSGVTHWQGWSVRVSQNTPNVVRVVIETEEPRNFTVLQGQDNAFKNSVIIQPSQSKNPFWDKVRLTQPKVMSALKQLYISNESPNTPVKFRLESQRPIQYKVVKESPTRFSVDLLNVTAPPEPMGFDVSHFPYLKSLSHMQSAQGSRLLVELNKPFEDLRSTPFTSLNALELSFNLVNPSRVNTPIRPENPSRPSNNGRKVIVIDAGHGGKDAGAMRDGIMEKNLNLSVALKLRNELQARGYLVYMTRSTDTFLSLKQITQVSESLKPHIFISVHHNSSNSSAIYGLETYYYHGFSLSLAQAVHAKQVQSLAVLDRGVRKNQFYVINHVKVPSILCELGYVSNANELKVLNTELRQRQQAKAIADGVDAYFKRNGR